MDRFSTISYDLRFTKSIQRQILKSFRSFKSMIARSCRGRTIKTNGYILMFQIECSFNFRVSILTTKDKMQQVQLGLTLLNSTVICPFPYAIILVVALHFILPFIMSMYSRCI